MSPLPRKAARAQDTLDFHPLASAFPLLTGDEFQEFVADIEAHGLREPITLFEDQILEGRNRYRACLRLKLKPEVVEFEGDDAAAFAFVMSRNIHRRHLKPREKREAIAALLKAKPEMSDRQAAGIVKASPTFVGKVRAEKQATGDVSTVDTRTDTKGRKQPAKKKKRPPTEDEFRKQMAAKRAADAPPAMPAKPVCDAVAPDGELELQRQFAQWFISERITVKYEIKDRDEYRALFNRVKAVLGSAP
jgi:ParB-like chromosome segregation protein Spo0J